MTAVSVREKVDSDDQTVREKVDGDDQSVREKVDSDDQTVREKVDSDDQTVKEKVDGDEQSVREKVDSDDQLVREKVDSDDQTVREKVDGDDQSVREKVEGDDQSVREKVDSDDQTVKEKVDVREKVDGDDQSVREKVDGDDQSVREKVDGDDQSIREKVDSDDQTVREKVDGDDQTVREKVDGDDRSVREKVDGDDRSVREKVDGDDRLVREKLLSLAGALAGVVQTDKSITAVLGVDVMLPCYYQAAASEKVAQVVWSKKVSNGQNIQVTILNTEYGAHVSEPYEGRIKEKAPLDPADGSIILKNAVQADEGLYQCLVNTFPAGNFETEIMLKVLVPPLPTLNPGPPLVEGEGKTLVASCTAEGNPAPTLVWVSEVSGSNSTRSTAHPRSASVTSEFYVVPTRSMNGKSVDCVISHPGFQQEKRISHTLSVRYLAAVSIQGHEEGWFAGKEDAVLKCLCEGNPAPEYKWTRVNISIPNGVKTEGERLIFQNPLSAEDAGVYICQATNQVSSRSSSITISIADSEPRKVDIVSVSLVSVGVVTAILLVILVITILLVNRHHKRRTQRLSEKIEELSTLSREASRRRLNSTTASTDTRMQLEESMHLRSGLHPDSLRDPSISSMMGEEADRRSYSTLTTVRETETQTELLSTVPDEDVKEESEETEQEELAQEEETEQVERDSSGVMENQPFIKQGMTHFYQENGTLRAKPTPNGIYINGRGHLV
ncbi:nectin-4 [Pelodytes ibericus]